MLSWTIKKKNRRYLTAVDDKDLSAPPQADIQQVVGSQAYQICENVWRNPNKAAVSRLKALGYQKGGKAKDLMDYMVEHGHVK
jgi:hypothetical protein